MSTSIDQVLALAENAVGLGYGRLKVKIWPGFDVQVAEALRATVAGRSLTSIRIRFQPPGAGSSPSGMGCPAPPAPEHPVPSSTGGPSGRDKTSPASPPPPSSAAASAASTAPR